MPLLAVSVGGLDIAWAFQSMLPIIVYPIRRKFFAIKGKGTGGLPSHANYSPTISRNGI